MRKILVTSSYGKLTIYSFNIHVYYIIEYVSELFNEVFDLIRMVLMCISP